MFLTERESHLSVRELFASKGFPFEGRLPQMRVVRWTCFNTSSVGYAATFTLKGKAISGDVSTHSLCSWLNMTDSIVIPSNVEGSPIMQQPCLFTLPYRAGKVNRPPKRRRVKISRS